MKPDPKCPCDLQDCGKTRVAFFAQCAIETLSAEPCLTSDLSHTLGPSDIAEGSGDPCHIVGCFDEPGIEVGRHLFRSAKLFGNIVRNSLRLGWLLGLAFRHGRTPTDFEPARWRAGCRVAATPCHRQRAGGSTRSLAGC